MHFQEATSYKCHLPSLSPQSAITLSHYNHISAIQCMCDMHNYNTTFFLGVYRRRWYLSAHAYDC